MKPPLRQQHVEVFVDIGAAVLDVLEGLVDAEEDEDVHDGYGEQKERGDERADDAADAVNGVDLILEGRRRCGDRDRGQDHDGRMAERKKEAHRRRTLAFLHQLARHIVDRGDMVGVDRMPEAETIGEECRAEEDRIIMECGERPRPCGDIESDQTT